MSDKTELMIQDYEYLIDQQAIKLQEYQTEIQCLKDELNWANECKMAYKAKRDELKLDFDKLCFRYNEVHNYNMDKRLKLIVAYNLIEELYNLDALYLDDVKDSKQWIDEVNRKASMFLQNNIEYKRND